MIFQWAGWMPLILLLRGKWGLLFCKRIPGRCLILTLYLVWGQPSHWESSRLVIFCSCSLWESKSAKGVFNIHTWTIHLLSKYQIFAPKLIHFLSLSLLRASSVWYSGVSGAENSVLLCLWRKWIYIMLCICSGQKWLPSPDPGWVSSLGWHLTGAQPCSGNHPALTCANRE